MVARRVRKCVHAARWYSCRRTPEQVTPVHLRWMILGDGPWTGWSWRLQPQRPVRAMPVVVLRVDTRDPIQMPLPDDQQPVQALGTHCANPTFRVGVGVGCLHRRQHDVGALRAEHVVEAAAELRVAIARQEAHAASLLLQYEQRVAGLLGDPGAVGLAVTPARWTRRVPSSRKHSTYSRLRQMVSTVKQVAGDDPGCLPAQERPPRRGGGRGAGSSAWRRRVCGWRSLRRAHRAGAAHP